MHRATDGTLEQVIQAGSVTYADDELLVVRDQEQQHLLRSAHERLSLPAEYAAIPTSAVRHGERIYLGSGQRIGAFSLDRGDMVWEADLENVKSDCLRPVLEAWQARFPFVTPALRVKAATESLVLLGTNFGALLALSASSGETAWTAGFPDVARETPFDVEVVWLLRSTLFVLNALPNWGPAVYGVFVDARDGTILERTSRSITAHGGRGARLSETRAVFAARDRFSVFNLNSRAFELDFREEDVEPFLVKPVVHGNRLIGVNQQELFVYELGLS